MLLSPDSLTDIKKGKELRNALLKLAPKLIYSTNYKEALMRILGLFLSDVTMVEFF
jgi:hypothetical protein